MKQHMREVTENDYASIAAVLQAAYPDKTFTVENLLKGDKINSEKLFARWVMEVDGRIVGTVSYSQSTDGYHPQKFWGRVVVHPDYRHHGLGSALYQWLMECLANFNAIQVRTEIDEDQTSDIQFAQKRGFYEDAREWESHLDLTTFDPAPFAGKEEELRTQGIVIKTRRELESDPDRNRHLYELDHELNSDVPMPPDETHTPIDFEYFVQNWMNNEKQSPADAYVIAVKDGEYIGQSSIWLVPEADYAMGDLTGVKRAYRRRGIALALKLRGAIYAKSRGYKSIRSWNDTRNAAMLSVNLRLGFVPQKAVISFVKKFD